ncbi:MAG: histone deacetylase [Planctomycetota bacterium]
MDLYYSDIFELPLPPGHRFPMAKYRLLRERLAASDWTGNCRFLIPEAASDEQLALAHSAEYIRRASSGELSDVEQRRIGFPWSERMIERSRRSSGASIGAAGSALRDGVAVNLAGGTHHANWDGGQGYCVFNDVCVAARVLQLEGAIQRALFVDCDVHQGNGTAAIAAGDPTLYSFSIHCVKNYPFRKATSDLDIDLAPGTGDGEYLEELERALRKIDLVFEPDLVFFLAGADPFEHDRLGHLRLSKSGLRQRDQLVLDFYRERRIPIAISMAGGYAPDVNDIVDIHYGTIETAWRSWNSDSRRIVKQ